MVAGSGSVVADASSVSRVQQLSGCRRQLSSHVRRLSGDLRWRSGRMRQLSDHGLRLSGRGLAAHNPQSCANRDYC